MNFRAALARATAEGRNGRVPTANIGMAIRLPRGNVESGNLPMNTSEILGSSGTPPRPVPSKWRPFQRLLLGLQARLTGDEAALRADVMASLEPHSQSEADSATDQFDHDLALAELQVEAGLLGEIAAALERIGKGTYGTCELTGRPIPAERLRAVPWTRFTVEAEAEVERHGGLGKAQLGALRSVLGSAQGITDAADGEVIDPLDQIPDPRS